MHLWSLTANPVVHLHRGEDGEVYVVGGGGFYRKLAKFQATDYCASSGTGCLNFPSIFLHESNNAGGANLGFGTAKRLVQDSKVRVFVEGRYVWIANTGVHGPGVYAIANTRTGYFPVLLGLKW